MIRLAIVLLIAGLAGCDGGVHDRGAPSNAESTMTVRPILDVLNAHTPRLMAVPGVVGTAQGELDGKPCIIIYVNELDERLRQKLPGTLEGHPVKIEEVGEIRPLD